MPLAAEEGGWQGHEGLLPLERFHRQMEPLKAAMASRARSLRGVGDEELTARLERAQSLMEAHRLDSILLTTEPDFFYFTGLHSKFWNSPTRPFFLLVPREGRRPVAVIPSIMASCIVSRTWLHAEQVHTWPAPRPEDDGVSLLAETIGALPRKFGRVGFMMGTETTVRMPLRDIDQVRRLLSEQGVATEDGWPLLRELRLVKSEWEVACVRHACAIASAAFALLPAKLHALLATKASSLSEREARDAFRALALDLGADAAAYVMAQSGRGGYDNIVLEPTDRPLTAGDILVIDTGIQFECYWCDFDRNYVVGGRSHLPDDAARLHDKLWLATEAGFEACSCGTKASAVFSAMARELGVGEQGADSPVGRFGHGLGLQLTELFSNSPTDHTELPAGCVMTLEPSMGISPDGELMLAHEENVLITAEGPQWLSVRAPRTMQSILEAEPFEDSTHADTLPALITELIHTLNL